MSLYDLSTDLLNGQPKNLADFRGKVTLLVNTASECGFTKQYDGLEKLHETYRDRGFSVLGFPSNDFGGQEPGSAEQIATFCSTRFNVAFPLFAKVKTKGEGQSPVFAFLAATAGEPKWNFYKYLVGKDGQVIAGFPSKVDPLAPELTGAIEAALVRAG
jgi:glutathione peroxidase